jgi:predicted GNAT family acetyltransferase
MSEAEVLHDPDRQLFYLEQAGKTAFLSYQWNGDKEVMVASTVTPPELRGQGLAGRLSQAATAWIREQGLKVHPHCSYYANYLRKHPEEQDLLAD